MEDMRRKLYEHTPQEVYEEEYFRSVRHLNRAERRTLAGKLAVQKAKIAALEAQNKALVDKLKELGD